MLQIGRETSNKDRRNTVSVRPGPTCQNRSSVTSRLHTQLRCPILSNPSLQQFGALELQFLTPYRINSLSRSLNNYFLYYEAPLAFRIMRPNLLSPYISSPNTLVDFVKWSGHTARTNWPPKHPQTLPPDYPPNHPPRVPWSYLPEYP